MAFRGGRGRGRGGRGRFGGGFERSGKKEPFILFPEDVTLPSLPNLETTSNEEKVQMRTKYKLENFWSASCYHLEEEAFPKSDKSKRRRVEESKDIEIERYSDRFKQMTHAKREALASYLKQTPSNFPAELIQGAKRVQRATKKLRWDSGAHKLEVFEKLEEKLKGKGEDGDKKESSEDEVEEEEDGEEESDDGDYNQNIDFDDDDDDMQEEGPEEDYYE